MRFWPFCIGTTLAAVIVVLSLESKAVMAPQFRWDEVCSSNSPAGPIAPGSSGNCSLIGSEYYAMEPPTDVATRLGKYTVSVYCEVGCEFNATYFIISDRPQQARVALFVAEPKSLSIELSHHKIIPGAARKPVQADFEHSAMKLESFPVNLVAVDITLPLVIGTNELIVREAEMMKTRGRGTDQVIRLMSAFFTPFRNWPKDEDFTFLMSFGFAQSVLGKSDGLKEARVEPLCHAYDIDGNKSEIPLVGYRDDRSDRVMYPILYRFSIPSLVSCWLGGRSALYRER